MPIRQWLHAEWFDILPKSEGLNRTPLNCRYDDQIAIFGQKFQKDILSKKFFLVGCGALGCEYIKMLALMGLGCSKEGRLFITDDDQIENSNLNRQFLFRKEHRKKSKSKTAGMVGVQMNPELHCEAYTERVCPENEKLFNAKFWSSLDGVCNALDNVKARKYVDG